MCSGLLYAYFTIRFLRILPTCSAASVVFSSSCMISFILISSMQSFSSSKSLVIKNSYTSSAWFSISCSLEQYSRRNEDLTVIFPGGIQLGTAIDVVQAAYGEASQHTESELVNVYNWYEDGSFYNSCEIDTNSTDGTVSMMGISRFEVRNGE